jgi:hypothetical protein
MGSCNEFLKFLLRMGAWTRYPEMPVVKTKNLLIKKQQVSRSILSKQEA